MTQVIMTNVASLNSQRQLNKSQASLNQSLERLSSGLRINSAKDDAAGLAISSRMTSQITGMNVAVRNSNDGISLAQTAEGALSSISDNLQRMRELSVQSANASNSTTDRAAIQQEVDQLSSEIDRVAQQTDFNGTKLLDGTFSAQAFQVGANVGQTITVSQISSARTSSLGITQGFSTTTALPSGTASDTAAVKSVVIGSGASIPLGTVATDAKAMSNAINAAGIAGMTATATATTVASAATAAATTTAGVATFTLNNIAINVNVTTAALGGSVSNKANALAAINAQSAATGVVASDDGTGLKLTALDGRNITVGAVSNTSGAGTTVADFGMIAATTTGGTLKISYTAPAGVTGNVTFTGTGLPVGAQAITGTGTAISALDVKTVDGANAAITSIDAALSSINSSKANLGAIQNRFTSVVANLQSSSENLSASRSRIQDADFAAETAAMSKANILQQAGTAMLAQANSAPQNVLSLLK